jgi:hypothetical protein
MGKLYCLRALVTREENWEFVYIAREERPSLYTSQEV